MNLAKGFSDRTDDTGKISFGLRWTNILKATSHWDQDFRNIIQTLSLIGISKAELFFATIEAARKRARIRKHILEESAIISEATDSGKLNETRIGSHGSGHSITTCQPFLFSTELPSAM